MPRTLTAEMLTALRSGYWRPVVFVYGQFNSGPVYAWSGLGTYDWNGHAWSGLGGLMRVQFPQQTGDVVADNFTIGLTGIPTANLHLALGEAKQGNPVQVWLGSRNEDNSIKPDPSLAASGRMDAPTIEESGETSSVTINCESLTVDLKTPRTGRFTDEDQQMRFPGDRFCAFVAAMQLWNRKW